LEVAADSVRVLSDGRILGVNERQNNLYVFDGNGLVAARCAVPGKICRVVEDGRRVFVVEIRAPETHGFISDELFDATSVHVWRLDAESQPDLKSIKGARRLPLFVRAGGAACFLQMLLIAG
ncbi:MAG: hypothetical protein J6X47_09135, partial [Clostridia bacterium]|nr:hypothetical protein [Clostridia bacterium]